MIRLEVGNSTLTEASLNMSSSPPPLPPPVASIDTEAAEQERNRVARIELARQRARGRAVSGGQRIARAKRQGQLSAANALGIEVL